MQDLNQFKTEPWIIQNARWKAGN